MSLNCVLNDAIPEGLVEQTCSGIFFALFELDYMDDHLLSSMVIITCANLFCKNQPEKFFKNFR